MVEKCPATIIEEFDRKKKKYYLSVEFFDKDGNILGQLEFKRSASEREIVGTLREDSVGVLLEASSKLPRRPGY
jgi:hypothetical protein